METNILSAFILGCFLFGSFLCSLAVVFLERKNPSSSIAWILLLLFLPGIGFVAYIFLGTGFRINKQKKYALKAINDNLYDNLIRGHLNIAEAIKFMSNHENAAPLINYLKNEGDGVYCGNNQAEIFTAGEDMFPRMIEDIKAAEDHVHLLFFIVKNDNIGREILSLLVEKAKQGIEVRLLYDSLGSWLLMNPPLLKKLRKAGGQALGFAPVFSNINSHLRLNYRNHRKITVIDGKTAYIGGMNIGDEYMSRDKKLRPWRDTHLRLNGPAVWFLQERFLMDWSYTSETDMSRQVSMEKYFPDIENISGNIGAQIVSSGPDTSGSPIKSGLLALIYGARRNIYIQTPYFAPDASFMDALRIAAKSGVDVRLMLPVLSDHWIVHQATLGYAKEALEAGVRVFLYQGFLHAKAVVSDSLVTSIGTLNLTNRSFVLDFEVTAFLYNTELARQYEKVFAEDEKHSTEITLSWFAQKSPKRRALYNFARLFAPLM